MFYEPGKTPHKLAHDPFKSCVVPRPIGWISTLAPTGARNLAPYSQFTNLTFAPPSVLFVANQTAAGRRKDTVRNAEAAGAFAWNMATWRLRHAVNASAEQVPFGVDEFARARLAAEDARVVRARGRPVPLVRDSPVRFECVYAGTLRVPGDWPMGTVDLVVGRVVAVHIDEAVLTAGKVDLAKALPIARCGYYEYAVVDKTFEMVIPGADSGKTLAGLAGDAVEHGRWSGEEQEEREADERGRQVARKPASKL